MGSRNDRSDKHLTQESLNLGIKKHGVAFSEACYVFADKYLLTLFDADHSVDEDRWITIGQALNGKILTVIHTYQSAGGKESIRIISTRRAAENEVKQYVERRR